MRVPPEEYLSWLLDIVQFNEQPIYWKACGILFYTPFEARVFRDDNRAADGLTLRQAFVDQTGCYIPDGEYMPECSVLEMMIALAQRIEFDNLHDPDLGDRTSEWFWLMFHNLGLDLYSDNYFAGKRMAMVQRDDVMEDRELRPMIDMNLGVQYSINKWLACYMQLNNYLGFGKLKYDIFYGYESQGINFLAGVTWSF